MDVTTSATLLERLGDIGDETAWERFYALYAPLVLSFARRRGCSHAAANDVLQETMVCLIRHMPSFLYCPQRGKFRSFLFEIAAARVKDAYRRQRRHEPVANSAELLARIPSAGGDDDGAAWKLWDRLWDWRLLVRALERIRSKVEATTLASFERSVLQQQPVSRIQEELGLPANTIYQHRSRVLKMLRREVQKLQAELGE